jgi:FAD/FMN-containing dehydrogenase
MSRPQGLGADLATDPTTDTAPSSTPTLPLAALRALLGPEGVITDAAERAFYSTDVYRHAAFDAELVLRPASVELLAAAVALCTGAGLAVIPRGGGLSYTGGFLPAQAGSVIVDMQGLDRIVEINETDMYVTVECGATWKSLYEALKPRGLRTPYFGPMSGYASTVGGALSQGSVFLGSTQYGTTADSVLGLELVLADGSRLVTGSAGGLHDPGPFFRHYGPDLTGLFLHDAGALGFKARATLRLMKTPAYSGFIGFTFGRQADLFAAMSEISRRGLAAECYAADPYIWGMRLWDDDLHRDVSRVLGVLKSGRSLGSGIKDAVRMAVGGRKALADVEYAMNVAIDGKCQAEVDHALEQVRAIGSAQGREIEATVPRMVRGAPFMPPNDVLGPKGQRWAPSHGIAPHSRIATVADALVAFFAERSELLQRHGIEWGYVAFAISTTAVLLEPMLYWPGAREPYHERVITPSHLAKLPVLPPDPAAAAAMQQLRDDLTRFWMTQGCAHLQIGKTYRYLESRQGPVRELLQSLKAAVDPRGLLNPGSLGLSKTGAPGE